MVKYFLIFIFALCFFFQACSAPVAVGYNENVVVDIGEDNWFNSEIELPDNSLVEFVVIGSLENPKKRESFSVPNASEYSFSTTQKNDELLSKHKILKARIIDRDSIIKRTFVINSSQKIFCPEGGTLFFETVAPDDFKHIVNVYVKEVEGFGKKKKPQKAKDKMGEARTRLAQDMKKTEVRGQRAKDGGQKTENGGRKTKVSSQKLEIKSDAKKGWNLEPSKEVSKPAKKVAISQPAKKPLLPGNYVDIRKKEEIPSGFEEIIIDEKNRLEIVKLPKEEEERLLSDILGISDPIEPFNRFMFKIDTTLFVYIFNPLGKVYSFVVPGYFREGFKRMDYNIQMPKRLFNNLLQAKFAGAGITLSRFLLNTTVGLVGFYDPAEAWFGWEKYDEDLGQTLGKWGVGPGFYVYIPVLGATSVRDGLGGIVDDQMDPRAWIPFGGSSVRFLMRFNNFTLDANYIEQQLEQYYDPYSLKKDFWYMKRTAEIAD